MERREAGSAFMGWHVMLLHHTGEAASSASAGFTSVRLLAPPPPALAPTIRQLPSHGLLPLTWHQPRPGTWPAPGKKKERKRQKGETRPASVAPLPAPPAKRPCQQHKAQLASPTSPPSRLLQLSPLRPTHPPPSPPPPSPPTPPPTCSCGRLSLKVGVSRLLSTENWWEGDSRYRALTCSKPCEEERRGEGDKERKQGRTRWASGRLW